MAVVIALWTRLEDHWRDRGMPSVDHASDFTPQHRFELRPEIILVQHWFEELRRLVPTN